MIEFCIFRICAKQRIAEPLTDLFESPRLTLDKEEDFPKIVDNHHQNLQDFSGGSRLVHFPILETPSIVFFWEVSLCVKNY